VERWNTTTIGRPSSELRCAEPLIAAPDDANDLASSTTMLLLRSYAAEFRTAGRECLAHHQVAACGRPLSSLMGAGHVDAFYMAPLRIRACQGNHLNCTRFFR
jgi:hypothetical protein